MHAGQVRTFFHQGIQYRKIVVGLKLLDECWQNQVAIMEMFDYMRHPGKVKVTVGNALQV